LPKIEAIQDIGGIKLSVDATSVHA
jgi:hypothetical protein